MRIPALLLLLGLSGCYTARTSVPSHIKTIGIPIFVNRSLQPAVEEEVTRRVIERFERNAQLKIAEPRNADAELEGTVTEYSNKVYRFNDQERADEYVVTIVFDITVTDRQKNKELWSQQGVRVSATYLVTGPQARTEAAARTEAIDQVADILLSRTVEGW